MRILINYSVKGFIKEIISITFIAFFLLFSFPKKASATHVMAADLSYEHLGDSLYEISITLYRECTQSPVPSSLRVSIGNDCGDSLFIDLFPEAYLSSGYPVGTEVGTVCPDESTLCNTGSLPGVKRYDYRATVVLPPCNEWRISYGLCCRNTVMTNLNDPTAQDMFIQATLDNSIEHNSSPKFLNHNTPFVCANELTTYSHGTVENDGDSLVYSFIRSRTDAGTIIPFSPGHSLGSQVLPYTLLNTNSGEITVEPSPNQFAAVAVLVEEYRNGALIGSTIRELQFLVKNCSNSNPGIDSVLTNLNNASFSQPLDITACAGNELSFDFSATDPDGDSVFIEIDNPSDFPGAVLTVNENSGSSTGTFTWSTSATQNGWHLLVLKLFDKACPYNGRSYITIPIYLEESADAGPDLNYCTGGVVPQIQALGGTSWNWTDLSGGAPTGLSCSSCLNPFASPTTTTSYIFNTNIGNGCKAIDTIVVNRVSDISLSASSSTDTICLGDDVTFSASVNSAEGPHTFSWYALGDSSILSNGFTLTLSPNTQFEFVVVAEGANGCRASDTVSVATDADRPVVSLPNDTAICFGDTLNIQADYRLDFVECGATGSSCSGSTNTYTAPRDGTWNFTVNFFQNAYTDARNQYLLRPELLKAWGMRSGNFESIAVYMNYKYGTQPFQDFTIKMKCVDDTVLTVSGGFLPGAQVVYTPKNFTAVTGWNNFLLDNPFTWDGNSSVLIEVCFNNSTYTSGYDRCGTTDAGYLSTITSTSRVAASQGCMLGSPSNDYTILPQLRFDVCEKTLSSPTYSWSPAGKLSNPNILNPNVVLDEDSINLTLTVVGANSNCPGLASFTLKRNLSVEARIVGDDCSGPAQLEAIVTGEALPEDITCGTNGTSCTSTLKAQIGSGNSISYSSVSPFDGSNRGKERHQWLYRASDLLAAGLTSGTITDITWFVNSNGTSAPFENYTIKLGCTSDPELYSSGGWVPTTTVFNPKNVSPVTGPNTMVFDNTFDWDGSSNIVIEVCWSNGSNPGTAIVDVNDYSYSCHIGGNPFNAASACNLPKTWTDSRAPNVEFTFCEPPPGDFTYTWTPSFGLNNPNIFNPVANPGMSMMYTVSVGGGACPAVDSVFLPECVPLNLNFISASKERKEQGFDIKWHFSEPEKVKEYLIQERYKNSFKLIDRVLPGYSSYFYEGFGNKSLRITAITEEEDIHSKIIRLEDHVFEPLIYPNPSKSGIFNIRIHANKGAFIRVFDSSGKMLLEKEYTEEIFELNLSENSSSVYFVQIKNGKELYSRILKK